MTDIELQNVTASYVPGVNILRGISATFQEGRISTIIGPNGAGKSTTLKSIYGFLEPNGGSITYGDTDLTNYGPSEMLSELGFAYVPQERSVFPDMTVQENLELGTWVLRRDQSKAQAAIESVYDDFPVLAEKRSDRAGSMSGGQQRMLEIGRSLLVDPEVVLVDEPTVGLAPKIASDIYDAIENLRENGITVLLVDQNVRPAVEIADEIFILERGTVADSGERAALSDEIESIISQWISPEFVA